MTKRGKIKKTYEKYDKKARKKGHKVKPLARKK